MTKNEFIAETAARIYSSSDQLTPKGAIDAARELSDKLEQQGIAPWTTESFFETSTAQES